MFAQIRTDLNRRILIESMRPEVLTSMAAAALENPSYVRTIRPRTPTWDFDAWTREFFVHDFVYEDCSTGRFVMNSSLFNRMTQTQLSSDNELLTL